jgi:hypothetical protein
LNLKEWAREQGVSYSPSGITAVDSPRVIGGPSG